MKKNKLIYGILISLAIVLVVATVVWRREDNSGAVTVKTAAVKTDRVMGTVSIAGKVDLAERVEVRPLAMGTLQELNYGLGDEVEKNAVVGRIDSKELDEQLAQARKAYNEADKRYKELESKVDEATKAIPKDNEIGEAFADATEAAFSMALVTGERELNMAKVNMEKIKVQINNCTVRAPGGGKVLYIAAQPGQRVSPQALLMILGEPSDLVVKAQVSETDLLKIAVGQEALVTSEAASEKTYHGEVTQISQLPFSTVNSSKLTATGSLDPGQLTSAGTQGETTYEVEIKLLDSNTLLKPGFSVNVDITLQEKGKVLAIPVEAVLEMDFGKQAGNGLTGPESEEDKDFALNDRKVYILDKNNVVRERKVKTGASGDTSVEILSGLKQGEKVILSPDEKAVRPGVSVKEER